MNILYTGRQVTIACAPITLRDRLHANFSVIPTEPPLAGLAPLTAVESVSINVTGGAEGMHAPPAPYPIIPALREAPPPEITINFLYTPQERWLLYLFNFPVYPEVGVDLLVVNRFTGGALCFPSCIPRTVTLNFSGGKLLSVNVGFIAPAGFVVPPGSAPPYQPAVDGARFVRNFTTFFNDVYGLPPLGTLEMSVSVNNTVSAHHTMLATLPTTQADLLSVRFARVFSFGIPTASANLRVFAPPTQLPAYKNGMGVAITLAGYDVDFDMPLVEFVLRGVIQSISANISTQGEIVYQVSVSGVGDTSAPPVVFL